MRRQARSWLFGRGGAATALVALTLLVPVALAPAQAGAAVGAEGARMVAPLTVLGLPERQAWELDVNEGIVGDAADGLLFEDAGVTRFALPGGNLDAAEPIDRSGGAELRIRDARTVTRAFLAEYFPITRADPRARALTDRIFSEGVASALTSPGDTRWIVVRTKAGRLYYADHAPGGAPSFARLRPVGLPRF